MRGLSELPISTLCSTQYVCVVLVLVLCLRPRLEMGEEGELAKRSRSRQEAQGSGLRNFRLGRCLRPTKGKTLLCL